MAQLNISFEDNDFDGYLVVLFKINSSTFTYIVNKKKWDIKYNDFSTIIYNIENNINSLDTVCDLNIYFKDNMVYFGIVGSIIITNLNKLYIINKFKYVNDYISRIIDL